MDKIVKKVNRDMRTIGQIPKESKHVLYNYGPSKDNMDSRLNPFTRFYFAIVDKRDAFREKTRSKLFDILSEQNSGIVQIGMDFNIKIDKSEWGVLFVVYDALRNLQDLKFAKRGINVKRDYDFRKKKVLKIEDYLRRIYE